MRHLGWFGVAALTLAACAGTGTQGLQQVSTLQASAAPVTIHNTGPASMAPYPSVTHLPSPSPSPGTVLSVTPVGKHPAGIAFDAAGNAWIANAGSDTVSELGPDGQTIATFAVGHEPKRVAVTPDGHVWVSDFGADAVTEIVDGHVLRQVKVGAEPNGLATDQYHLWVANYGAGTLTEISSGGTVLNTLNVGADAKSGPTDVQLDASGTVWVACAQGGLYGYTQTGLETVGNDLGGRSPSTLTRDAAGNFWLTFNPPDADTLAIVDAHGKTQAILPVLVPKNGIVGPGGVDANGDFWSAGTPYLVASDGAIASPGPKGNLVSQIDAQGKVRAWYATADAWAAAVDAKHVVWVLDYAAGTVTRLAPAS